MANEWTILEISFPEVGHIMVLRKGICLQPHLLFYFHGQWHQSSSGPSQRTENVQYIPPPKTGEDQWRISKAFGTRMLALICPEKMCYYSDNFCFWHLLYCPPSSRVRRFKIRYPASHMYHPFLVRINKWAEALPKRTHLIDQRLRLFVLAGI